MVMKYLITWYLEVFFIFTCIVFLFQEELSRVICPATFESIYFFSSWNTWRNSCTMLMKAALCPCLCPQRYTRFNQHAVEKILFTLFLWHNAVNYFLIILSHKQEYLRALRWIDHLNLNNSCRRCGPFSGPTKAHAWSGCLECAPPSSR